MWYPDIKDDDKSKIDNDAFLQTVDIHIDKNNSLDCGIEAVSDLENTDEEQDEQQDIQTEPMDWKRKRKSVSYKGMDEDDDEKPKKRKKT